MNKAAKQSFVLALVVAALGLLAWRLWPDPAQARRHQRDRALIRAVQANDLSAATRLLGTGADPNGHLPPISVSRKAQIYYLYSSRLRRVPAWGDLERMDRHWSLLEVAALLGNADMVSALLAKGADVNYHDRAGNTALTLAGKLNGDSRNGSDYPRVLALLNAAVARPRPAGNKP